MTRSKEKRRRSAPTKPAAKQAAPKSEAALSSPGVTHLDPPREWATIEGLDVNPPYADSYTITSSEPGSVPRTVAIREPQLIPQPRGGAILSGGKPGNKGGTGRPTNEIRDMLRTLVGEQTHVIADIAAGEPVQRTRVSVAALLKHAHCPSCDKKSLQLTTIDDLFEEIAVTISASPRDRIAALEFASRYGVGALKEVSVQSVRERVGKTLDLIQERVSPEQYAAITEAIAPVWS